MSAVPSPRHRSLLDGICAWLAAAVPLAVTLSRLGPGGDWRADLAMVRSIGAVPSVGKGCLSSWLVDFMLAVPFGDRELRTTLVAVAALAVTGRWVYSLARDFLESNAATKRLTPCLALTAALLATLSAKWQIAGSVAGGASVSGSLVLGLVLLRSRLSPADARTWAFTGILVALAGLEDVSAGLVAAGIAALDTLSYRKPLAPRLFAVSLVAALAAACALLLPTMMRSPVALLRDPTTEVAGFSPAVASVAPSVVTQWLDQIGLFALAMAAVGAASGLLMPSARRRLIPWLLIPLLELVLPSLGLTDASTGSSAVVSLLSAVSVAILGALGVQTASLAVIRVKLPFAQPLSVLLVVVFVSVTMVAGEDSSKYLAERRAGAAQVWTEEAFAALPTDSLLLVRSPEVLMRLWAARIVGFERPDLVIVPLPVLDDADLALAFLEREPALGPLVRDMVISGRPGEFSLSTLADARPLYVQLGPAWDRRLLDHLVPHPLWLEFAPHALGRSDRNEALRDGRQAFTRVLESALAPLSRDTATLDVLAARAQENAVVLASLGDREILERVLVDLERIEPQRPFVREMRRRLDKDRRGAIDIAGLLETSAEDSGSSSG